MGKFILIGGMPRSGTNLARRIIGSHSRIAIPPGEFNFFSQYVSGKGVREIVANERLKRWEIDLTDLSDEHSRAFIDALVRYAHSVGKEIPGEKTPNNEFFFGVIQEWLKDFELKFVHLVRNPLDAIASYKNAPFRLRQNLKFDRDVVSVLARNWQRSASMGLARAYSNPKECYLLKYEDLTADPVQVTRALCTFLGVEFEQERMLNLTDFEGYKDNTSFERDQGNEHRDYGAIRKPKSRKHHLTGSEIKIVSSVCGELARSLGYDDEDFVLSLPERPSVDIRKRLRRTARNYLRSGLTLRRANSSYK